MKTILTLWALPLVFFWGWYALSLNDMNFGIFVLSKPFHDHLFGIYGKILGMDAADVPMTLAWLFFLDTLLLVVLTVLGAYRKVWIPFVTNYVKVHILRKKPTVEQNTTHLDQFYNRSNTSSPNSVQH